ncbi:MAG: acyl-CoA dehydrogenase family protein [Ottowia sp.]|uniref:acyl-CoA dehydrogenase family protein n=1 Tax=Ottowia sp. TaxID=1898956 RepID=UPI0039E2FB6C
MSERDELTAMVNQQAERQFRELMTPEAIERASMGEWLPALWQQVEDAGWPSALVAEAQGGVGLPSGAAFDVVRLSGYRGVPLPLAETMAGRGLWTAAGGDPGLVADRPVLLGVGAHVRAPALRLDGGTSSLTGETGSVAFGGAPGALLLVQAHRRDDAHALVLLDVQKLAPRPVRALSFETPCAFSLGSVPVPPDHCQPWDVRDQRALQAVGAVLRSVQMVGAMQRCLALGLQYAQERVQFGRPISRFTPVQDMLVEAAAEVSAAVNAASLAVDHWRPAPTPDGVFAAAVAKSRCGEAAGRVAAFIHQVHGAMGFTQEHVLHQFTRRLWAWRDEFGTEAYWNHQIGARACAADGHSLWPMLTAL